MFFRSPERRAPRAPDVRAAILSPASRPLPKHEAVPISKHAITLSPDARLLPGQSNRGRGEFQHDPIIQDMNRRITTTKTTARSARHAWARILSLALVGTLAPWAGAAPGETHTGERATVVKFAVS